MAKPFTDSQGREWHARIDTGTLVAFELDTGVQFLKLAACPGGMQEMMTSLSNLLRLVYRACRRDVEERDVSFEAFCEALGAETLEAVAESAGEAVNEYYGALAERKSAASADPRPSP